MKTAALLFLSCITSAIAARDLSPLDAYNRGVDALKKGTLREAENWFLQSAASQRESIQPPALYDLGHVRFRQGAELLKGESKREIVIDRGDTANEDGIDATMRANRALKKDQLNDILEAYMQGRPVRKQLRLAHEDVQRALDLYGAVLVRWRRSVGDFRSSHELKASEDATFNARVVERHIEELLKHVQQLEMLKMQVGKTRGELKEKMAELKGKIPADMLQPGADGEEDEDEEEDGQPKPEPGMQRAGNEGEKRGITPEIAQQILEALLGLKGERKLPLGERDPNGFAIDPNGDPSKPRDRKGRDW